MCYFKPFHHSLQSIRQNNNKWQRLCLRDFMWAWWLHCHYFLLENKHSTTNWCLFKNYNYHNCFVVENKMDPTFTLSLNIYLNSTLHRNLFIEFRARHSFLLHKQNQAKLTNILGKCFCCVSITWTCACLVFYLDQKTLQEVFPEDRQQWEKGKRLIKNLVISDSEFWVWIERGRERN